jgi:hypothetical protein
MLSRFGGFLQIGFVSGRLPFSLIRIQHYVLPDVGQQNSGENSKILIFDCLLQKNGKDNSKVFISTL